MTFAELYHITVSKFANFETAIKQIIIHLAHFQDHHELITNWHHPCSITTTEIDQWLTQVVRGKPLAYLLKKVTCQHMSLHIDRHVLIPRPATEELLLIVHNLLLHQPNLSTNPCWEFGTGSGIIAIHLAKWFPHLQIIASDYSQKALNIATMNARCYKNIQLIKTNGIKYFLKAKYLFDIIIANPPYIGTKEIVSRHVLKWEPKRALFAKQDGLFFYKLIIKHAHTLQAKLICFEINPLLRAQLYHLIIIELGDQVEFWFQKDLQKQWRFCFIISKSICL